MPNRCVAAACGNMPSDSVSLFRFPKEPHLCDLWTRQVQRTRANWKPTSASVLCSEHFCVDCFDDIPSLKASLGFAVLPFSNATIMCRKRRHESRQRSKNLQRKG